jgi:anti-sigma factor RsiW
MIWNRRQTMPHWLARVLGPGKPQVTCEQCFELLDRYVEGELRGADADAAFPGMAAHLEGCPACRQEHELLLAYARERES